MDSCRMKKKKKKKKRENLLNYGFPNHNLDNYLFKNISKSTTSTSHITNPEPKI